jgi:hypothetical protein
MFKNKAAGKAFNRLQHDFHAASEEFEQCDRHFDAGEYSGPAWGRIYEETEQRHLNLVAFAYHITTDDVWDVSQRLEHDEEARRFAATTPWEAYTDDAGVRHHGRLCHEHWDRGLNCSCISEQEQQRIKSALARGDAHDDIIGPGWGQF